MSVRKFLWLLSEAKVSGSDNEWFPRWLRRYAQTAACHLATVRAAVALEAIQRLPAWSDRRLSFSAEDRRPLALECGAVVRVGVR